MEKITLAGMEYDLPEINFMTMKQLSKLGFNKSNVKNIQEDPMELVTILVSYITKTTKDEAEQIIAKSCPKFKDFEALSDKLDKWFEDSDFFGD